jgi:hypothetical protein
MLNSIGRNENRRERLCGAWNASECRCRKSVGPDICKRRVDDGDLNQCLLVELLSCLAGFLNRDLSLFLPLCPSCLSLSLSCSNVFSYVFSLDHSGSADGRGMRVGWSRKTTMFLSIPVGFSTPSGAERGPNSLGRGFSSAPQQRIELSHENDMLPDEMQPTMLEKRSHASETSDIQRPATREQRNRAHKQKHMTENKTGGSAGAAIF